MYPSGGGQRQQVCRAVWKSPKDMSTIFHNRKSHDFYSHERGGAKAKGVEETAGVEADSANSTG